MPPKFAVPSGGRSGPLEIRANLELIHHVVTGEGRPTVVLVHGFGCAHADWDLQVAHLSPRHRTIAVDLRGHGGSPGAPEDCSIERYGADVADVMRAVSLPPSILVGHSMGCRVVIEAALQAPAETAGVILADGSQFAPGSEAALRERFATPDGYAATVQGLFAQMFTPKSDRTVAASVTARAECLPRAVGEKLLTDMSRYDTTRLAASLACLRVPVMVLQTTYTNEKRERRPLHEGQITPYLDMIRTSIPASRIEIIPDTGHFPQLDESERMNALIESFLADLPVC